MKVFQRFTRTTSSAIGALDNEDATNRSAVAMSSRAARESPRCVSGGRESERNWWTKPVTASVRAASVRPRTQAAKASANPRLSPTVTAIRDRLATRLRRTHLRSRSCAPGGRATIGSWARNRRKSDASASTEA